MNIHSEVKDLLWGLTRTQASKVLIKRSTLDKALGPHITNSLIIEQMQMQSAPAKSFNLKAFDVFDDPTPKASADYVKVVRREVVNMLVEWQRMNPSPQK
jgi:hypothetical protein